MNSELFWISRLEKNVNRQRALLTLCGQQAGQRSILTECDFVLRFVTKLLNGSFEHVRILSIDFHLENGKRNSCTCQARSRKFFVLPVQLPSQKSAHPGLCTLSASSPPKWWWTRATSGWSGCKEWPVLVHPRSWRVHAHKRRPKWWEPHWDHKSRPWCQNTFWEAKIRIEDS